MEILDERYLAPRPEFGFGEGAAREPGRLVDRGQGILAFEPHPDFQGSIGFDYSVADAQGAEAMGQARIDVGTLVAAMAAFGPGNGEESAHEGVTTQDTPLAQVGWEGFQA